ncbi:MAG: TIGR01212 family radical SAM protein, partial [Proteobacteria bacterium]|nr:TIGR01212 family radical SAM protein [Pseudomonadota bacterium]
MRYYHLRRYLTRRFGLRVAKIALDAGLTCPNRDGALSRSGCLFCDALGSGSGGAAEGLSVREQLEAALSRSRRRADRFIAYFQAFTNTYAPVDRLESLWTQALAHEDVVGLAVGTRPDCLPDEVIDLLASLARDREVWLELGLQSASERTLERINRGHTVSDFARAVRRTRGRGFKVLAHVIIGLPGEGPEDTLETARFVNDLGLDGIKIHSLYVSQDTGLAFMYERGDYDCLSREAFVEQTVDFLERIDPRMVVHRLTGDPRPESLLAPAWTLDKSGTLEMIRQR